MEIEVKNVFKAIDKVDFVSKNPKKRITNIFRISINSIGMVQFDHDNTQKVEIASIMSSFLRDHKMVAALMATYLELSKTK